MSVTESEVKANEGTDLYPSRKKPEPELIKRKDPVVYTDGSQGPLSKEQFEFYDKNGYLFLEKFFTDEEVKLLKDELNRVWENSAHDERAEVIRERSSNVVRSVFAVHRDNEVFQKLSLHERLTGVIKQILGEEIYVHQSRINFKPGFTGKEFYWHSDFETWHVEDGMPRMRALSVSIALEENYSYNGPLMVIPGSQEYFISCVGETPEDHFKNSLRKQEYGVPDEANLTKFAKENGIETPTGPAGSVLFFDCNIMHGSNSNITPYPRSNVFMVFNSEENRLAPPYSGQKPRPDYIATR